jgi:hypothetical protein
MTELDLLCKIPYQEEAHVSAMSMYHAKKPQFGADPFFHNGMGA